MHSRTCNLVTSQSTAQTLQQYLRVQPSKAHEPCFVLQAGNGQYSRGAEKALTEAQLVDLPNTGAFVLPLAAHTFLVGLLVIEQLAPPIQPVPSTAADVVQPAQLAAVSPGKQLNAN